MDGESLEHWGILELVADVVPHQVDIQAVLNQLQDIMIYPPVNITSFCLRHVGWYYHLKQFNDSKSKFVPVLNQAPQHEGLGLWQSRYIAPCAPNLGIRCRSVGRFTTCSIYALEKGCQCPMNKKLPSMPWKRAASAQWTSNWLAPELNKMLY